MHYKEVQLKWLIKYTLFTSGRAKQSGAEGGFEPPPRYQRD